MQIECPCEPRKLLLALDENGDAAAAVDDRLRERVAARAGVATANVRIWSVDVRGASLLDVNVRVAAVGGRARSIAKTLQAESELRAARRCCADGPIGAESGRRSELAEGLAGVPTVVSAKATTGLGPLANVYDPRSLTFYGAFVGALGDVREKRFEGRGARLDDAYARPGPYRGAVLTNESAWARRRKQDEVSTARAEIDPIPRGTRGVVAATAGRSIYLTVAASSRPRSARRPRRRRDPASNVAETSRRDVREHVACIS